MDSKDKKSQRNVAERRKQEPQLDIVPCTLGIYVSAYIVGFVSSGGSLVTGHVNDV